MTMSSAVKELLVALKTVVSNFIVAKPISEVIRKEATRTIGSHHPPTPPPSPHTNAHRKIALAYFKLISK